jgi:hypothetical protein
MSARASDAPSLLERYAAQIQAVEATAATGTVTKREQPADRKCVDASQSTIARSGDFAVAGFGMYSATWQQKQGNLMFKPTTPQQGVRLTVHAENLDRPGAVTEVYAPLTGSMSEGSSSYQVRMQLPDKGNWLITARAGESFGCFIYAFR